MKKRVFFPVLFGILIIGTILGYNRWRAEQLLGPDAPESQDISEWLEESVTPSPSEPPAEIDTTEEVETPSEDPLPTSLNIDMPFYTQAPFSNWDYPWQEACEEASSALVANLYLEKNWTRESFNEELLRLVDYEMEAFGAYEHTSVEQTVQMIQDNYGLKTVVHENPSYEDLQKTLASGHLIIAPLAGKLLGNPNFTNGGPTYHMLVIKGYDSTQNQVVTHDVGTRNGADYVYSWSVIQNALHDWHEGDITLGTPRWIEVYP